MIGEGEPGTNRPSIPLVQQQMDAMWEQHENGITPAADRAGIPSIPVEDSRVAAEALAAWNANRIRPPSRHRHRGKRPSYGEADTKSADRRAAAIREVELRQSFMAGGITAVEAY